MSALTPSGHPCVIVTRPAREAATWVQSLSQAGLQAQALPLIDILPVIDPSAVHRAWQGLHDYAAVMFVSANAVAGFFAFKPIQAQWGVAQDAAQPSTSARAWATGLGTVAALQQAGVPLEAINAPSSEAAQFDSEALWQRVGGQVRPGQRVLIVRGGDGQEVSATQDEGRSVGAGRDWLAARLTEAGAVVEFVVTYQRGLPRWSAAQAQLAAQAAGDGSLWLLSSSEAVHNLRSLLPAQNWSGVRALATHARIASAARALGFGVVGESRPTLADIVGSIKSLR